MALVTVTAGVDLERWVECATGFNVGKRVAMQRRDPVVHADPESRDALTTVGHRRMTSTNPRSLSATIRFICSVQTTSTSIMAVTPDRRQSIMRYAS